MIGSAQGAALTGYNVDINQTTVSGLSSGGYMAMQFDVAFSSFVKGAGIIAGGPYYCAQGSESTATSVCSCFPSCTGTPDVGSLITATDRIAGQGKIDPISNLRQQRIYMFSGTADTVVPPRVMDSLKTYLANYVDAASVSYKNDLNAQHTQPTLDFGNQCATLGDPFISKCAYDAAGELLKWIYGPLNPRNVGQLGGAFVQFDQSEFLAAPASHGMDPTGWLYVPAACQNGQPCRLHIAFHGCKQFQSYRFFQLGAGMTTFGTTFVKNAGYNQWADSNAIIVLYPQATVRAGNPNGCWDWWGYDDSDYAVKSGRQMAAVRGMVERIVSGHVSLPAPTGLAVTGTTDSSVSLKWDALSQATGFNVYRNGRKVNDPAILTTGFTDSGLTSGTTFTYAVAGVGSAGSESGKSAGVSATTTGPPPAAPPAPSGLKVDTVDGASVSLSWTGAPSAAGYHVLRGTVSGGPYAQVDTDPLTATSFKDIGVLPGTTYFYVVEAVNGSGTASQPSNEVTARTPAAASCFTATNFDHVQAGRAHDVLAIAQANGSNQVMGLDNIFIVTTLRKTGENFYEIGSCPP